MEQGLIVGTDSWQNWAVAIGYLSFTLFIAWRVLT
jgi:hypothetical protein